MLIMLSTHTQWLLISNSILHFLHFYYYQLNVDCYYDSCSIFTSFYVPILHNFLSYAFLINFQILSFYLIGFSCTLHTILCSFARKLIMYFYKRIRKSLHWTSLSQLLGFMSLKQEYHTLHLWNRHNLLYFTHLLS